MFSLLTWLVYAAFARSQLAHSSQHIRKHLPGWNVQAGTSVVGILMSVHTLTFLAVHWTREALGTVHQVMPPALVLDDNALQWCSIPVGL